MAKLENTFKKHLVSIMGTRWDVQSHEDRYSTGVPDLSFGVNGVNGWIELKQIKRWPKLDITPAKPEHYTSEQVNWLSRRGKKGGYCYVMVKVGRETFVFPWMYARMVAKGMTKSEYYIHCIAWWDGPINPNELITALTATPYAFESVPIRISSSG